MDELRSRNILEQPLVRQKSKVSLSAYSFLFSEIVQYSLTNSSKDLPFTQILHIMGTEIGNRILDYLTVREKINTRFTNIVSLLTFISTTVWKYLFNHHCLLLKEKDDNKEYMLNDRELQITKYISMPKNVMVSAHDIVDESNRKSLTILVQSNPK